MLKKLVLLALLVAVHVQPLLPQAPAQPGGAQADQKPKTNPAAVVKSDNQVTSDEGTKKGSVAAEDTDKWVRRGFWINVSLSLITMIIAGATWMQAKAAEIQARALMGVSVPTLAVSKFSFVNDGRENPVAFYRGPKIRLELKNYGQSPAFLRKFSIDYSWTESVTEKFTWYPFEDVVIDAGKTYELSESDLGVLESPPEEVIGDLVSGKRLLVFSGWVSYGDVFGSKPRKLRLSRKLYEYDPDPGKMMALDTSGATLWTDTGDDEEQPVYPN